MGKGNLSPIESGQIALRFPRLPDMSPGSPHSHLDGLGSGLNGSSKGNYRRGFHNVGSGIVKPSTGNSQWQLYRLAEISCFFENYFRENGIGVLADGVPRVDLPEYPIQITGQAGDLVIAHHQIVHTVVPSHAPNIRYAAIFRLRHQQTTFIGNEAYTDIWREWPGIQEVTDQL